MLSTNPVSSCFLEGMPEAQPGHLQGQGPLEAACVWKRRIYSVCVFEHVRHPLGARARVAWLRGWKL